MKGHCQRNLLFRKWRIHFADVGMKGYNEVEKGAEEMGIVTTLREM